MPSLGAPASVIADSPATTSVAEDRASTLAYVGLSFATVGWASGFIAGKLALTDMTPLPVAAWRYAVAAAVLLPFALRQWPARGARVFSAPFAFMILAGGIAYPWLFLRALSSTSATNTSLLIALNPVLTTLLTPIVGEKLERRRLAGILVAFVGAAVVVTRGDLGLVTGLSLHAGDLFALAGASMWAVFNLLSRKVVAHLTPAFTNCAIYVLGSVALFILGWGESPWTQVTSARPMALGGIVAMAIFSSVLAGQFFLVGIRQVGVTRTVVFVYFVPVLTAALSALLLGERLEAAQVIGGATVLAGVYLTTRPSR